jgi:DNA-binding transcriptional LysR family regulator
MELHQLSIFLAVAQTRSFSAAAEIIHITQPAVSMQVQLLERELGCTLLHRDRRGAVLTPEGQAVCRTALLMAAEVQALKSEIAGFQDLSRGQIGIACSDTFAAYVLTTIISEFSSSYPGISVSIFNGTSTEIQSMLLDHRVDVGFLSVDGADKGVDFAQRMTYRYTAVVRPDHSLGNRDLLRLSDLRDQTLLLLEKGTRAREHADQALTAAEVKPAHIIDLGSVAVQQEFAAAGIGVALVPEFAALQHLESKRLAMIPVEELPAREIGVATKRARRKTAAVSAFIELCQEGHLL